ncbi:MAG: YoaK family protein [Candidatus Nanopelagicales bacterium]
MADQTKSVVIPERDSLRVWLNTYLPGLYLLGVIAGIVDAACFLGLGAVFAEMMTGNMVLFAFSVMGNDSLARGDWANPWTYIFILVTFAIGAAVCGFLMRRSAALAKNRKLFMVQWVLMIVAALLATIFQPTGAGVYSVLIVATLALGMGFQNALVIRHGVPNLATNLMTLTFTALFANSPKEDPMWIRRVFSILTFVVGACIGVLLLNFGVAVPLWVAAILMTIAVFWLITRPAPPELSGRL